MSPGSPASGRANLGTKMNRYDETMFDETKIRHKRPHQFCLAKNDRKTDKNRKIKNNRNIPSLKDVFLAFCPQKK